VAVNHPILSEKPGRCCQNVSLWLSTYL